MKPERAKAASYYIARKYVDLDKLQESHTTPDMTTLQPHNTMLIRVLVLLHKPTS